MKPDTVFTIDHVVRFATRRHRIWEGRGTKDPILTSRKFTNVFRVLDRGSQYLIELMNTYDDPLDRLALSYFYRQVNRPDTMEDIITANDGYVPSYAQITDPAFYDDVVQPVADARPGAFLSGAYMILIKPGDSRGTVGKMQAMFPAAGPHLQEIAGLTDLEARVKRLRKVPGLGPFMAMQCATDLGYCSGEPDQENTFVLAGPGSRKGVGFISDAKPEHVIQTFPVADIPPLPDSNGRHASWMDVQNVFCEFSKWARHVRAGYVPTSGPYKKYKPPFKTTIPEHFVK